MKWFLINDLSNSAQTTWVIMHLIRHQNVKQDIIMDFELRKEVLNNCRCTILVLRVAALTGERSVGAVFLGNFSPAHVRKLLCQATVKLKSQLAWV